MSFLGAIVLTLALAVHPTPSPVHSGRDGQVDVPIPRIEAGIEVDGVLDEPAWQEAAQLTGFSQYAPVDGQPAEQQTIVLAWYSPTAIHFGVRANAAAGSVRATLADRDRLDTEDQIQIFLSTFNDGRQAFMFAVNPLGVQADGALTEGTQRPTRGFNGLGTGREAVDLSPDFVFQSRGRLTADGYEVEIRIPFKSLRYQATATQDWGLQIIRRVQSKGHEDSWTPARRAAASFLGQAGRLRGLTELRRGLVLDLNPAVTSRLDGGPAAGGWDYAGGRPEFGANIRWGLTTNLTLNGTVNPDFSQVEADAGQFVFDPRAALFFAEKRPFFLDGIEQFTTPNNLIYTRRIVSPIGAAKVTGKLSGFGIALLTAVDDEATSRQGAHPVFTIARLQRDLGPRAKAAFVYTDRIDGGDSNRVAALDSQVTFRQVYRLQMQAALSRTVRGGEALTAPLWDISLNRDGRRFGFLYLLRGIDGDFRTESGFLSRVGIAQALIDHRLTLYGARGAVVESWTNDLVLDGTWQYEMFVAGGRAQDRKLHLNSNVVLRGGWRAGGSLLVETFGYDDRLYADYGLLRHGTPTARPRPSCRSPACPTCRTSITSCRWHDAAVQDPLGQRRSCSGAATRTSSSGRQRTSSSRAIAADWRPDAAAAASTRSTNSSSTAGARMTAWSAGAAFPGCGSSTSSRARSSCGGSASTTRREQDDLRDDSRTELPIVIRNRATGEYERALGSTRNQFRNDWLFSYQPTPGTVIFAGYGSTVTEDRPLRFQDLHRVRDGFFLKVSYLFRL
jgi:hypothetical protein